MSDLFSRGYDVSREKVRKSAKYSRSCFNCEYYYKKGKDTEECCQNSEVLQYDMVVTNNSISCSYWKQSESTSDKKSLFRKTGRSVLD